jgi:SAM-dependent methyltransferase
MNWKYLLIGLVRPYVPAKLLFAITKWRADGNVEEDSPDNCLEAWNGQFQKSGLKFSDKQVLEIGSGRYARFALQMLAAGAKRVTLVDPYAVPLKQPAHLAMLTKDCVKLGLDCDDVLSRIDVVSCDITGLPAPNSNDKVDLAISYSVLEHVRDPEAVLKCCFRWLKPGGVTHHIIDLRDHSFRFRYPFEMLTFSDRVWSRWLNLRGGFHLNRWRASDYVRAAQNAGFINVGYEVLSKDDQALKQIFRRLHPRFRSMPTEILALLFISLYCQKPFQFEGA